MAAHYWVRIKSPLQLNVSSNLFFKLTNEKVVLCLVLMSCYADALRFKREGK